MGVRNISTKYKVIRKKKHIGKTILVHNLDGRKVSRNKPTNQKTIGAGVAQRLCNGLPNDGLWFDSRWARCKNRASRPSQKTFNGGVISK